MKVKDLIEKLKEFPDNAIIYAMCPPDGAYVKIIDCECDSVNTVSLGLEEYYGD